MSTPQFYLPSEVASLLRVDPKTVTRWAIAGHIPSTRTPGGHLRIHRDHIDGLLAAMFPDHTDSAG